MKDGSTNMQMQKMNRKVIALRVLGFFLLIFWLLQSGKLRFNKIFIPKSYSQGVDISHYQGDVDMERLADRGIDFLYIKATEGSDYVDEYYEKNYRKAKKAGLISGAYHFFSFDSEGKKQAEFFISEVGNQNGRLVPAVDIEYYQDKRKNKPDVEETRKSLQECLDVLEAEYGKKPVIYTTLPVYYRYIKGNFEEYPLWIRNVYYPAGIGLGEKWAFWQYDDMSRLAVYEGDTEYIDRNVFHGSKDELEKELVLEREFAYTYTFQVCSNDILNDMLRGKQYEQYGFRNPYSGCTGDMHSLFIGQVIALFGEPEYWTEDYEDLFSQAVSATDKDGNVFLLEVYHGPSGPAIKGFADEDSVFGEEEYQKAIDELAQYIMDAEPADFEWSSGYGDALVTIKMGVKNGEPYYETEYLPEKLLREKLGDDYSEEKMQEIMQRIMKED